MLKQPSKHYYFQKIDQTQIPKRDYTLKEMQVPTVFDLKRIVRESVRNSSGYNVSHFIRAWSNKDLLRMMSNENPLPPSKAVIDAMASEIDATNLYPAPPSGLCERFAKHVKMNPENIAVCAGSMEVIDVLIRTFVEPGQEVLIHSPTFSAYEKFANLHGAKLTSVKMSPPVFEYPFEAMEKRITDKTKIVFVCTPNNPTGNYCEREYIERLARNNVIVAVDEAYAEYIDQNMTDLISSYPNIVFIRTLSKAWGLAGLRIGYLIADEQVIDYFSRVAQPFHITMPIQRAVEAAFDDVQYLPKRVEANRAGVDYIRKELETIPGVETFPSSGNFVLINAGDTGHDTQDIIEKLLDLGIFARDMSSHRLGGAYFRITVSSPENNQRFIEAMKHILKP
ncbi:MAG: histidinol-phosphate transaminase [Candidatus Hermodarchaeia archaeon]|jgi:histidinol-phosphate aminotransferase